MKRIGITAVALLAVLAMSAASASAFTLPDVSVSLGGTYPLHLQGTLTATATNLDTASGSRLEGTGVTLLLLTKELTSLGEFTSTFTKVHEPGKSAELCHTTGDATGVVLIGGIFHIVLTAASGGQLAVLYLVKETEIICPKLEIAVKGSVISTLKVGAEKEELTTASGKLSGNAKGEQELTEYVNDGGTISKALLLSNAGQGFVLSDEIVAEELKLEALESKMFVISPR
jgi:hypothetical protein